MASFNLVVLMGNLTRDPEIRYTPGGTAVCDVGLAVNRKWKNDAGEQMDEVSYFTCTAFGQQAETLSQYLRKGSPVLLNGRLKQDTWVDKASGQNRSAVKVVITGFTFLPSPGREGAPGHAPGPPKARLAQRGEEAQADAPPSEPQADAPAPADDDVPF